MKRFLPIILFLCLFLPLTGAVVEQYHHLTFQQGALLPDKENTLLFSPSSPDSWEKTSNFLERLVFSLGKTVEITAKQRMIRKGDPKNSPDTAWDLRSRKFSVAEYETLYVTLQCFGTVNIFRFHGFRDNFINRLLFFDKAGKVIGTEPLEFKIESSRKNSFRWNFPIPVKATEAQLELGADTPDLPPGAKITFHRIAVNGFRKNAPPFLDGFFITTPFHFRGRPVLSWPNDLPEGTKVLIQAAFAPDEQGRPGKFSEFSGPAGKKSFYRKRLLFPTALARAPRNCEWAKLKVFLLPSSDGKKIPVLRELSAGKYSFSNWNRTEAAEVAASAVRVSRSPSSDCQKQLVFHLKCEVPWIKSRFRVLLNGKDITHLLLPLKHEYYSYLPEGGFQKKTVYKTEVFTETIYGKKNCSTFYFFFDDPLIKNVVTIRKDGFLLIDGKPHFPIGATYVLPVANEPDQDKAFEWLKAAGVNNVFGPRKKNGFREYLDKVAAHGLRMYVSPGIKGGANCRDLDLMLQNIAAEYRHPAVIGWYIGDDTLDHNTPEEMRLKHEAIRSIDPYHITLQADSIGSMKPYADKALPGDPSRYRDVVNFTDNLRAELYPVRGLTEKVKKECVPEVICDMRTVFRDLRDKAEKPKNIWAIIQYFEGWTSWKRFPTWQELRAMTWAAVIHGAHGLQWYTYRHDKKNHGFSYTPETRRNFTRIVGEVAPLAEVIMGQTVRGMVPMILLGAKKDALNNDSISILVKYHRGEFYLFAVNSSMDELRVLFPVHPLGKVETLYENDRKVLVDDIGIIDDFKPLAVHIYRFCEK